MHNAERENASSLTRNDRNKKKKLVAEKKKKRGKKKVTIYLFVPAEVLVVLRLAPPTGADAAKSAAPSASLRVLGFTRPILLVFSSLLIGGGRGELPSCVRECVLMLVTGGGSGPKSSVVSTSPDPL